MLRWGSNYKVELMVYVCGEVSLNILIGSLLLRDIVIKNLVNSWFVWLYFIVDIFDLRLDNMELY